MEISLRERTGMVFEKVMSKPTLRGLLTDFIKMARGNLAMLQSRKDPLLRARVRFNAYEKAAAIDVKFEKANVKGSQAPSCKKGCSACCSLRVSVQPDEAAVLWQRAAELGTDTTIIERQAAAMVGRERDDQHWYTMPIEERWCAFLDRAKGECTVYDDRPLMCRDMLVASPPENCKVTDTDGPATFIVRIFSAVFCDLTMSYLKPEDSNVDMATAMMRLK